MLDRIRAAIATQLERLGAEDVSELRETLLIRQGLFCGRKYQCGAYYVVWFMEEDEVKFFGPNSQLLMSSTAQQCLSGMEAPQVQQPQRRAA